ncbi:MAG: formate/nitrite transporter family protein [Chloroflexota bacterium]
MDPEQTPPGVPRIEHFSPKEIAHAVDTQGVSKANASVLTTVALGVLGGAFVGLGGMFTVTVLGHPDGDSAGTTVLAGFAFSLGFVISIVAGADLFTSNNLVAMSWVSRRTPLTRLLRNWAVVYLSNLGGALSVAVIAYASDWWQAQEASVGGAALETAADKLSSSFEAAFLSALLANALVCLAAWMAIGGRSTTDKTIVTILPVTAMAAMGLQHIVGLMFFAPLGLLLSDSAAAMAASGLAPDELEAITIPRAFATMIPVTLGNIVGGGVLVGLVYWFIYIRPQHRWS